MAKNDSIRNVLATVSRRVQIRRMVDWSGKGLVIGCFLALVLACLSAFGLSVHWGWMFAVATGIALIGAILGRWIPVSLSSSARLIDSFYVMKDRAVTALQFQHDSDPVRHASGSRR